MWWESWCSLLWLFARRVAVRGGKLKRIKAGGGLGGRAQRLPPVHSLVDWHSFGCTCVSSVPRGSSCSSCCCCCCCRCLLVSTFLHFFFSSLLCFSRFPCLFISSFLRSFFFCLHFFVSWFLRFLLFSFLPFSFFLHFFGSSFPGFSFLHCLCLGSLCLHFSFVFTAEYSYFLVVFLICVFDPAMFFWSC